MTANAGVDLPQREPAAGGNQEGLREKLQRFQRERDASKNNIVKVRDNISQKGSISGSIDNI